MIKRPICVALVMIIAAILLFYRLEERDDLRTEDGKEKTILCQVDEISGDGESITVTSTSPDSYSLKVYEKKGANLFQSLKIGNIISLSGTFYCFEKPGNPGQFNEYEFYKQAEIDAKFFANSLTVQNPKVKKLQQKLHEIRIAFLRQFKKCLPKEEYGILSAMILGEKSALTKEVKTLYRRNGIAHILAISGLHISLIGAGLFFFLRRFVFPMRIACLGTVIVLFFYGELTGFSTATARAIGMMSLLLLARFIGRRYDMLNALCFSACIELIRHPFSLYQAGFLLSYGTVFGIICFLPQWENIFGKSNYMIYVSKHSSVLLSPTVYRICQKLWKLAAGNVGILLVTLPILLYFYYEINSLSAIVNILILPFISTLILFGILGGTISFFSIVFGKFILGIVPFVLEYYRLLCEWCVQISGVMWISGQPEFWRIGIYYAGIIGWLFRKKKSTRHIVIIVVSVLILCLPVPDNKNISITNLDVGQGDCTCIRTKDRTILIDGGSSTVKQVGSERISQFLKYMGVSKIDYVFLTHSDSDHINGMVELLEEKHVIGIEISTVVLPHIQKQDENYKQLEKICQNSGVRLEKMERGDCLSLPEQLNLTCLHPKRDYDWQSENDYSLVLQMQYGNFNGLFMGDLEFAGERELENLPSDIDYLKVSHHGSKGATSENLLQQIKPKIAVISAGKNNSFGHPAPETLNRLQEAGTMVYSTIESGAISLVTDGSKMEVKEYRE